MSKEEEKEHKRQINRRWKKERAENYFSDKIEGYDYIVCQECGLKAGELTSHIHKVHKISPENYKLKHNVHSLKAQKYVNRMKGENNPAYQHGGKYSPFSEKFLHGYDEDWHKEQMEKNRQYMLENPGEFQWQYYLEQAGGDEQLAKELHMKHQRKTLKYFIDKYGEEEGVRRHKLKTERWLKSFKKGDFSQISQQLFRSIMKNYNGNVYYATLERPEMKSYKNKEFILETENSYVRPDFVDLNTQKIIEFDGDYWHSEAVANPEREFIRDEEIRKQGYEVFHVKEHDYKQNPDKVIQECLDFLKS